MLGVAFFYKVEIHVVKAIYCLKIRFLIKFILGAGDNIQLFGYLPDWSATDNPFV